MLLFNHLLCWCTLMFKWKTYTLYLEYLQKFRRAMRPFFTRVIIMVCLALIQSHQFNSLTSSGSISWFENRFIFFIYLKKALPGFSLSGKYCRLAKIWYSASNSSFSTRQSISRWNDSNAALLGIFSIN